jgi:hypothetical protein
MYLRLAFGELFNWVNLPAFGDAQPFRADVVWAPSQKREAENRDETQRIGIGEEICMVWGSRRSCDWAQEGRT